VSVHELLSLAGRRALITGGGRGLGRALAVAFAEAGAEVVVVGRRQALVDETARIVSEAGGTATAIEADITVEDDVQRIAAGAGRIDILVNNAALYPSEPWQTVSLDSWHEVLKVNLYAPFRLCQVFVPPMMERGWGRVINIASVYGQTGPKPQLYPETWGPSSYFASKHGINGITHYLSPRIARHGVTINSMAPGGIVTPDQTVNLDEAGKRRLANAEPFAQAQVQIGRVGDGTDYVGPALLLASDGGKYITGQVVVVDGGWTTW
jgi:NAD(P)-dependent dehydrogenase (short-subunit alcohol dehydrogenase family)